MAKSVHRAERIGVLGGTFDPIHRTHVAVAQAVIARVGLDRVFFVVSAAPPHKWGEVFASPEDRLAMVEAALRGEPAMEACRIELDRPGPSYTVDTLRELRAARPAAEFFFIMGYDALADFPGWHDPEGVLAQARLLAVRRPGIDELNCPWLEGRFEEIPFSECGLSSTEVRARLASGAPVDDVLSPGVVEWIEERGLYGRGK